MSDARVRSAEQSPEVDIPWSNRGLMVPIFNVAAPLIFSPQTHFEGGEEGKQAWREHTESDAPTMILMTHFEEADAVMMAPIVQQNPALHPIRYETIVTAKEGLRQLKIGVPVVGGLPGWIVRNGGTSPVERPYDNLTETPEEKAARQDKNLHTRQVGVAVMEAGGNKLIFAEGGTKKRTKLPNGEFKVEKRERDELLPFQRGFAEIIKQCSPETQEKLRIMLIGSRYPEKQPPEPGASKVSKLLKGLGRIASPTVHISLPLTPIEGSVEQMVAQAQGIMAKDYEQVIAFDNARYPTA